MVQILKNLGNNKARVFPDEFVKKYGLEEDKSDIYKRIEAQANEPETIAYYKKSPNGFSDIDLDIIDE